MKKWLIRFMLPIFLAGVAACSPNVGSNGAAASEQTQSTVPAVAQGKTYIVGTDPTYPPFELRDDQGQVIGFDADIIRAIAKQQGFQVKILSEPWDGLLQDLNADKYDIVIADITIIDERANEVDLSQPYIYDQDSIMVRADNSDIHGLSDLKDKVVAAQSQTVQFDTITALQKGGSGKLIGEPTNYLPVKDLLDHKVEAVFGDANVLRYYEKESNRENKQVRLITDPSSKKQPAAIAVKKGNTQLLNQINAGLEAIRKDGTYQKIYEKWFGVSAENQ